ncbi:MAG: hypothetical protein IJX81_02440 [Clostridia bacterium]|nr:hypothetical protein [Clostridia bacterium]
MIKPELKAEIERDIDICQKCLDEKSSNNTSVYHNVVAKYVMVDKDFCVGIPNYVKTIGSNYFAELEVVVQKLKMYLILDDIPIKYQDNVATNANVSITGEKVIVKGNVGQGNETHKETTISLNNSAGEKKSGFLTWIKRLFGGQK